ncbi:MAG: leucine-rich repeat protein [Clostridiales bacterium]|nr:leucine-rich repeat protein [Clostridiales bacterium]
MNKTKQKLLILVLAVMLTLTATLLIACNNSPLHLKDGISSIKGATRSGNEFTMHVYGNVKTVDLSDKVKCGVGCTWKLCADDEYGQREIASKVAPVGEGENIYYIVVTSYITNDSLTYTLIIYRNSEITIHYYDGSILLYIDTCQTGVEYTASYQPTLEGYTFNRWVDATGKPFTTETLWEPISLYADKTGNKYAVSLSVNGGNQLSKTEYELTYGSSFTLPVPTRTGYSFLGWYAGNNQLTGANGASLSTWSTAQNAQLAARWQANNYDVTITRSDTSAGSVTGAGKHAYESSVTVTASTNAGYTWVGWFDGNTKLTDNQSYTFTMGLGRSLTAKWSKVTVATNISGAGVINGLSGKYKVGDSTILSVTTYMGYKFLGWFDGDTLLSNQSTYTIKLTENNATYTAKWQANEELQLFRFTSTINTCTITGIYDKTVTEIIVPDYVTAINEGAFNGCSQLESITVPFIGAYASYGTKDYLYPFGYIFNGPSFEGSTIVRGYYRRADGTGSNMRLHTVPGSLRSVTVTGGEVHYCAFNEFDMLESIVLNKTTTIGEYAFAECTNLAQIYIPASVTSIGAKAFDGCSSLNNILFDADIKLASIGEQVFKDTTGLLSIQFPNSVTEIGESAFINSGLTEIEWNNVVTVGSSAFEGCTGLTSLTIPNTLQSLGKGVFKNCTNISTLHWNNSQCVIGDTIFEGCTALTTLVIGEDIPSIPSKAFEYLENLVSVTIPSNITHIGASAFSNCTSLSQVTLSDGLRIINSGAFAHCDSLLSITLPSTVNIIGNSAFYYSAIESISIPSGVKEIGSYTFSHCSNLTRVELPDGITTFGWYAFAYCDVLTEINLPAHLTEIPTYCFYKSGVTNIEIPADVQTIGEYAFSDCSSLSVLTFASGSKLNSIDERAFWWANIRILELPEGIETVNATAFSSNDLERIVIPSSMKVLKSSAFGSNTNLQTVEWYPFDCTLDGSAFYKCGNFNVIFHGQTELPAYMYAGSNVTEYTVPDNITTIGDSAFSGCSQLSVITIHENVTYIGRDAFNRCTNIYLVNWNVIELTSSVSFSSATNLTKVVFGDKVKVIPNTMFYGCKELKNVQLPDSLETINYSAFNGCTSLTAITIPENVTRIGSGTFGGCTNLKEVTFVNAKGWIANRTYPLGDDRLLSETELLDAEHAAQLLTVTYAERSWSRT